jgi:predicted GNAT superfamily acetyltransferase
MTRPDGTLGIGLDAAWAVAGDAASVAGVDIRELHGTDVTLAQEVIGQVWGAQLIPQEVLLRALAHAGCTLLGAVVDEEPIGLDPWVPGMEGRHTPALAHDGTGVRSRIGRVGYAIKVWQRAVCMREGIREIRWTYDPLVARNAHFNLVKLGAVVESLHANFYGAMVDTVNAGDESDRFEVSWWLDSSRVLAALSGHPHLPTDVVRSHEIPEDYTTLARSNPAAVREARLAARAALLAAQDARLAIEWNGGAYRFTRRASTEGLRASAAVTCD